MYLNRVAPNAAPPTVVAPVGNPKLEVVVAGGTTGVEGCLVMGRRIGDSLSVELADPASSHTP